MRENALLEAQQILRVDLDRPFADIGPSARRTGVKGFLDFLDNLSSQERAEIRSRCAIIGSDRRFAEWARDLCGQVEQTSGQHDQSASYQGN